MKFTFNPAPNYRCSLSTTQIMRELLLGLLVVYGFSLCFYGVNYGMDYLVQAILIMVVSVISTYVVEFVWCLGSKQNFKEYAGKSFSYITAVIFALMLPIGTSLYAVAISAACATLLGKLVFGGFGQNIFNPAALGRAIIFAAFASMTVAEITTAATPTSLMAGTYSWAASGDAAASLLGTYSLVDLLLGWYPGALGETSALLIGIVGIFLAWRKVIDWRVPVVYIGSVFVITSLMALVNGFGFYYPFYHILSGGLFFGAVFMATDPVTSPTSAAGRCIFALGCGILTVLIRVKANLPEGVLYSILIMNCLTPLIERSLDGEQRKMMKKAVTSFAVVAVVGVAACMLAISQVTPVTAAPSTNAEGGMVVASADLGDVEANIVSSSDSEVVVATKGFGGMNEFTVALENGAVKSVAVNSWADTEGISDAAKSEDYLAKFVGIDSAEFEAEVATGATFSSKSVIKAVSVALGGEGSASNEGNASSNLVASADLGDVEANIVSSSDSEVVVSAKGFGGMNEFTVVLENGAVKSVAVNSWADTEGISDAAKSEDYLAKFVGIDSAEFEAEVATGATFSSKSVIKAVSVALGGADASADGKEEAGLAALVADVEANVLETNEVDGNTVVKVEAQGFQDKNVYEVSVDADKNVVSVACVEFKDTPSIGDQATSEDYLAQFVGKNADTLDVEVVSGATFTSKATIKAVLEALAQ